ncbi:DUF721 domain-containing protein [Pseudochelatococcus contaminans]|uniref:DUF721 domain-containing protein n=1 Tax=Pseudochelatococcus contaminans TaxID=1538103 RepID=A0A7W6EEP7_9HYPH|nr:DciA family protein [Pseudochelatococcus contaminans]MBB3808296.1 hypothetical protein [Pseudochelatococcus contaminans]
MNQRSFTVRRSVRPRPLAEFIDRCIEPALAAQGFAASDVIMAWPEIVGERLARHTEPMRIIWPKRANGAAKSVAQNAAQQQMSTLVVRVSSAFAIELQHMAPVVIERVNTHFGWRCVGQLGLRQGPIRRQTRQPLPERKLDPEQERRVADAVGDIAHDPLREALLRLGASIMSTRAS